MNKRCTVCDGEGVRHFKSHPKVQCEFCGGAGYITKGTGVAKKSGPHWIDTETDCMGNNFSDADGGL